MSTALDWSTTANLAQTGLLFTCLRLLRAYITAHRNFTKASDTWAGPGCLSFFPTSRFLPIRPLRSQTTRTIERCT